jgi:hypothetical protein
VKTISATSAVLGEILFYFSQYDFGDLFFCQSFHFYLNELFV